MDNIQTATIQSEIVGLEDTRCHALVEADIETLDELVSDDVVHVHGNGKVDDKITYMKMMRKQVRFLKAERDRLDVRV
ncbi:nuclear transport factor 2 family protein [Paraburkholderia sp. CNPSo 3274]|uniref:nuclear transport factor 2 family protein n=1 Tax=Paraburkholderia sp. CNPSo 3274 TaxID=2940932 RepID=UPI0020B7620E|nr:nuclear transport factor 2 family protein [Paraburkholderia sp. CNPSo 3274]MCP3705645.1 nuclear transport factor 2 family protein [Paraburkholderia sp. CNPSo 3274]